MILLSEIVFSMLDIVCLLFASFQFRKLVLLAEEEKASAQMPKLVMFAYGIIVYLLIRINTIN